jgi:predicted transposase YbfD/YdcC
MDTAPRLSLTAHFATLDDPRVERTKLHPLLSIVTIALCAVIAGAESWDDVELFGESKADWLSSFLDLPHGIPSHDTFNRVVAALDPDQFRTCFQHWMEAIAGVLKAQVIALDGKTVRRSHDRANGTRAIHMVSAWATETRLVLTQMKVEEKSNEITALPDLLAQLTLAGCIVTIDAMGCQREIAQQVLEGSGEYVLGLKGNQGSVHQDVQRSFALATAGDFTDSTQAVTVEKGHGRIETRRARVLADAAIITWLQEHHGWPGLAAIGWVQAERRIGSERSVEDRYYLLARALDATTFSAAVRSHWGIENQVHWVLDVTFHEDQSRIRAGYAAENLAVLRHTALNLLRQATTKRTSIKGRRLKAAWDTALSPPGSHH